MARAQIAGLGLHLYDPPSIHAPASLHHLAEPPTRSRPGPRPAPSALRGLTPAARPRLVALDTLPLVVQ